MAYTYDDFYKRAAGNNMLGRFSQQDLQIAQNNPEYGLSLMTLWQDLDNAVSDDAKLISQAAIDQLRTNYSTVPMGTTGYGREGQYQQTVDDITGYGSFGFADQGTLDQKNQEAINMGPHQYDKQGQLDSAIGSAANYDPFVFAGQSALDQKNQEAINMGPHQYDKQGQLDSAIGSAADYDPFVFAGQSALDQKNQEALNMGPHQYDKQGQLDSVIGSATNYGPFQYSQAAALQQALQQATNPGAFQYGNEKAYQNALAAVLNPAAFSYEMEEDPSWSAYKKKFLREGERASADALARAAAATGGIPSSYAVSAAQQAGANYAEQLTDMIPVLFQNAYQRYLNDQALKQTALQAISADRADAYAKHQDAYAQLLNIYNLLSSERSNEYGQYMDQYGMLQNAANLLMTDKSMSQEEYDRNLNTLLTQIGLLEGQRNAAYGEHQDEYDKLMNTVNLLMTGKNMSQDEYDRNLNTLLTQIGLLEGQRDTAYGEYQDGYDKLMNTVNLLMTDKSMSQEEYDRNLNTLLTQIGLLDGQRDTEYGLYQDGYNQLLSKLGVLQDDFGKYLTERELSSIGGPDPSASGELPGMGDGTQDVPDSVQTGVSDADKAWVLQNYPNGVVTSQSVWDMLVGIYGEETLEAAGIRFGNGTEGDQTLDSQTPPASGGISTGNIPLETLQDNTSTGSPQKPVATGGGGLSTGSIPLETLQDDISTGRFTHASTGGGVSLGNVPVETLQNGPADGASAPFSGTDTQKVDYQSIKDLGLGNLTAAEIQLLVLAGQVEEYVENGYVHYRWKTNKPAATGGGSVATLGNNAINSQIVSTLRN